MNILTPLLILLSLSWVVSPTGNPGILLSVPFPIDLPTISLPLPMALDNIVISNLELTSTFLQTLNYQWNLDIKHALVTVSEARINFNWTYKGDSGVGFFTQEGLQLQFYYSFGSSNTNHFKINVTSTKIRPGHSKVSLGGKVPETIIVEVTNLILNHASILFRGFISITEFTQTITDMSSIIGQDKHIYTDKPTGKEFYINTSLVAAPVTSGQNLIVQLNGAIYPKGETSGELNPEDILIRTNSSRIQVHIHKKIVSQFISQLLKARGGDFSLTLHTFDITSIINVNSLLLSPVFPPMADFTDDRDVIFNLKCPSVDFSFNGDNLRFQLALFTNVYTHNAIDKRDELYIDRIDGKMTVEIYPVFGKIRNSIRIGKIEVTDFQPHPSDIAAGRLIPDAIEPYFGFLTEWIGDAINLELNRKTVSFTYKDILAVMAGKVTKDMDYYIQITIKDRLHSKE